MKKIHIILLLCFLLPVIPVKAEDVTSNVVPVVHELRHENDNEWYIYTDGKKNLQYTDLYHYTAQNLWCYIVNGRWDRSFQGVVQYSANKKNYYINNGVIDRSYSGLYQDKHTSIWWYLENGIVNTKYLGLVLYEQNGKLYYINNGLIDRSFSGTVYYPVTEKKYSVVNGVATGIVTEMTPVLQADRSKTLKGIDISAWQDDLVLSRIDCDFIILKATEGAGVVDRLFETNFAEARRLNKRIGFYHFARPFNTPYEEADYFYEHTKQYFHLGIPILDWEAENTSNVQWAKTWLDTIYARSGVKPMIYMNEYTANAYDWSSVSNAGYKLWIAKYNNQYLNYNYNLSTAGTPPRSVYWPDYSMWQYTEQGRLTGYSNRLDLNVFYGGGQYWDQLAGKQIVQSLSQSQVYDYSQYQNNSLLSKPKLTAIYNSAHGADVRWKPQTGVDEYLLMRKENGVWHSVAVLPVSSLKTENGNYKYIDPTVKDLFGKGYIYSVAAKRGESVSAYDTKGLAFYRLKQPTIISAYCIGRDAVELHWTEEDCHGYEVQYSVDGGKTWIKTAPTEKTAKTISGLIPNCKYTFRIRCQKTNKDRGTTWSAYSSWKSIWVE